MNYLLYVTHMISQFKNYIYFETVYTRQFKYLYIYITHLPKTHFFIIIFLMIEENLKQSEVGE